MERWTIRVLPALAAMCACAAPMASAQTAAPSSYDPAFVQQMLKRLEAQEAEIKKLKTELGRQGGDAGGGPDAARAESFPKLSFHGFGNVDYTLNNTVGANGRAARNTFALGQLDFFVTSQLSDTISILGEVVMEAGGDNSMGIDLERLLFKWKPNDYLNLDVGRYHTSVGYYNTAYHHGTWFQTAVGRPQFLDFEDGGGIIPAHNVGIHVNGDVPSGSLGLGYILELGNGRAYNEANPGAVQNIVDGSKYKAFNVAFIARPEALPGFQMGAGLYHDTLSPVLAAGTALAPVARTDELMFHAHAIYKGGPWEYLSEGYLVRHRTKGDSAHHTPAGFGQVAYKFDSLTPFLRLTYVNAIAADQAWPVIGSHGLRWGPGVGIRWDFSTLAAFKLQYDHIYTHVSKTSDPASVDFKGWNSSFTAQIAFTF